MAGKLTSMRVISAVIAVAEGGTVNVARVCREAGVSRKTFYKWLGRYRAEGIEGVAERSRCPHRCPGQTSAEVEDWIVGKRKQLADAGLDHGATTIQWHMGRAQLALIPAVSTIHRILVRRGQVTAQPGKRPKGSWHRFEAPAPNEWWQIDAMNWTIATGGVKVFNIIDDHSRVAVRSRTCVDETGENAWTTFSEGAAVWGMPAGVLSDNGLAFSGKLRHFEVIFEARLRDIGIRPFTGRAFHPQTTGKVERFQQTLKRWLRHQPLAGNLIELQAQLDQFCWIYNHERPHQGIGRVTPISRWQASPPSIPAPATLEHPTWPKTPEPRHLTVSPDGILRVHKIRIALGVEYGRCPATVIIDDQHATVFINSQLIRHLTIDHSRSYQPTRRPRGGPTRPRLHS
jgi:transposase InsO family protein